MEIKPLLCYLQGVHNWTRGHAAFRVLEQQIDSDRLKSIEGMKEGILDCAKSAGASPLASGHRCVRHGPPTSSWLLMSHVLIAHRRDEELDSLSATKVVGAGQAVSSRYISMHACASRVTSAFRHCFRCEKSAL